MTSDTQNLSILRLCDITPAEIVGLLNKYNLDLVSVGLDTQIPGSFWGDEEAGLVGNKVYARPDTPIHSIFHESCHYICMSSNRREKLHTDAGGTQDEENAVCYLQLVLCSEVNCITPEKMMSDMDTWGYNFMLGSCKAWFEQDAEDSKQWLLNHHLINDSNKPTYKLRA